MACHWKKGEKMDRDEEKFILSAFGGFYEYLETLPDGEALQADMVLVGQAAEVVLEHGGNNSQASVAAYRLAEVAASAPSVFEAFVGTFNWLGEVLMPR
jgi:hypothetical protein